MEIIKELNTLIQSRIEIEDIFTPLHSLHNHNPRPRTNHPLQPNLRPIKEWIDDPPRNEKFLKSVFPHLASRHKIKQIRPLIRGKFYLTHGPEWDIWNSMPNWQYTGALDIIYILTKEEVKNYRRAKPLVIPREEPEKEIIAMKWPAFWATYTYFPAPTLLICTHVHHATGWGVTVAVNESEFVKKFKQLIPIGDAKIIALNYPNL